VTNDYTLGTGNRLASWGTNGSVSYDVSGNTTNLVSNDGRELSLQWDERYRLTSVEGRDGSPQPSVSYSYDVLGRKVSRTAGVSPAEVEYYVYNGHQVAADLDGNGNVIRSYTWGPGIDNLLSMTLHPAITNSTDLTISTPLTLYPIKDHQNSVLAFTDSSGTMVETYEYDAWGSVTVFDSSGAEINSSNIGNRYLWQGREYDSATGLYYFRARWYDPETGRWLSKDLIGIAGGLNLYVFCGNNPVNFVDPLGLEWFGDGTAGIVGRDDSIVEPGEGNLGGWIEKYIPAGETWGRIHDPLVGALVPNLGGPGNDTLTEKIIDLIVNVPTMPVCYVAAVLTETAKSAAAATASVAGLFTAAFNALTGGGSSGGGSSSGGSSGSGKK